MSMNATSDRTELTSRAERIDAADYLLLDDGDMSGPKYGTDPERGEAYCAECRCRVTVGTDGAEYGHVSGCSHRPEEWPRTNNDIGTLEQRGIDAVEPEGSA